MKQKLLFYLAFMFLAMPGLFAQIFVVEAMDGGVPGGWTQSGYSSSSLNPCEGSAGVRDNLWSSSTSGFLQTPTQTSNGSDVAVSFDWQATDFFGDPVDFTTIVDYTIDGGTTYTQIGTYGATAVTACTNFSATILAADVPNGVDFNLRITASWNSGDHYHYVDNVSVTQMVSSPPNCDAALTSALVDFPLDGTLTWSGATGAPDDYLLTVGTTSGGSDIVASTATGGTSFDLSAAGLAFSTTYFVTITPTNANGSATGCTEESFVTEADPNQAFTVDCTAGATNTTHCYGNVDVSTFSYTSSDGTSGLELTFNAGEIEDGFDFITIYDGTDNTGTVLYTGDNGGDLTGVVAAGGTSIFMEISSDGSVSCGQGSFTVDWDWDVVCTACVPASATGAVVLACPTTAVSVDVAITDLGSATALVITNSANATSVPAAAAGTVNVPGFMLGDGTVTITVADAADPTCATTFDIEIPAACPPANDACADAAAIACGDIDVAGTTTAATDDNPEACNFAGDGTAGGVWYTVVGDGSTMVVTVNADPGNADDLGDSQLAVYSGACGALVCETGNDDSTPPGGSGSQVTFVSVAGTTYYFYVDGWSANSGDFLISLECCAGNTVDFTNEDLTSSVNLFSQDAAGVQTWLGVTIAPGATYQASGAPGETIIIRDVATMVALDSYTFGSASCETDAYGILAFTDVLPCDAGQGGFQSYPVATGVNKKDFARTTMYNGPFGDQLFEDNIANMIGVNGNYVYLADPATNQVSSYVLSTGKWITTYTATDFVGGSAAGPIASANILGVANTFRANVLGADGSIDTYSLIDGSLLQDNPQTVFKTGPLDGTTFASANIIGCARNINVITVLEADGTLVEYTIRGVYYGNDFSAASLSGGQMDGSTFTAEAGRIVGMNGVGDVLMVSECTAPTAPARVIVDAPITQTSIGLEEVAFSAFPNPLNNSNVLTLNVKNLDTPIQSTVTIMDATGKVWNVKQIADLQNGNFEINMANLPQGLYFLNIRSGATLKTLKVVK